MFSKLVKDYKKNNLKSNLRKELKVKILKEDSGGKSGQWNARKAQLFVNAYEKNKIKYKKNNNTRQSKKSLNDYNSKVTKILDKKTYNPTLKMVQNAEQGLKLHKQLKKGGTKMGIKRAVDLKNQKILVLKVHLLKLYCLVAVGRRCRRSLV